MKPLLSTAGVLALVLSAAACDTADTSDTANYETTEMAETSTPGMDDTGMDTDTASTRTNFTLASGEMEASDLIGASIHDAAGEEIATVSDVLMSANGGTPMLVLRDGGIAGVGGGLHTMEFAAASIVPDPDTSGDEPDVIVQYSGDGIETLPEFEQAGMDDYRLASEMIGTTVGMSHNGESARINDMILTSTGEARYLVISPDLVTTDQIVIDADAIMVAQGDTDGTLTLDLTADDFTSAPQYVRD